MEGEYNFKLGANGSIHETVNNEYYSNVTTPAGTRITSNKSSISAYRVNWWQRRKEGNILESFLYGTANGLYTQGQFFMGRSVAGPFATNYDDAMLNIDGTYARTDDAVEGFVSTYSWALGGGATKSAAGPAEAWFRVKPSFSKSLDVPTQKSWIWGSNQYFRSKKIPDPMFRDLNKFLRNIKLPGSSNRVIDPGHYHRKF